RPPRTRRSRRTGACHPHPAPRAPAPRPPRSLPPSPGQRSRRAGRAPADDWTPHSRSDSSSVVPARRSASRPSPRRSASAATAPGPPRQLLEHLLRDPRDLSGHLPGNGLGELAEPPQMTGHLARDRTLHRSFPPGEAQAARHPGVRPAPSPPRAPAPPRPRKRTSGAHPRRGGGALRTGRGPPPAPRPGTRTRPGPAAPPRGRPPPPHPPPQPTGAPHASAPVGRAAAPAPRPPARKSLPRPPPYLSRPVADGPGPAPPPTPPP